MWAQLSISSFRLDMGDLKSCDMCLSQVKAAHNKLNNYALNIYFPRVMTWTQVNTSICIGTSDNDGICLEKY